MSNLLIWSDRARSEYLKLQEYLISEWGHEIAQRVTDGIDKTIMRIQNSPEQFPIFLKTKKLRRCVASPQTSIYFKINKNDIEIYAVFDNRRNPKKLKL